AAGLLRQRDRAAVDAELAVERGAHDHTHAVLGIQEQVLLDAVLPLPVREQLAEFRAGGIDGSRLASTRGIRHRADVRLAVRVDPGLLCLLGRRVRERGGDVPIQVGDRDVLDISAAVGLPRDDLVANEDRLHAANIEIILDVVYNHTAEGDQLGPTLSLRGIDNASYYRLQPNDWRFHVDFTGCGNTLNMQNPRVVQLIMDSLRYWVLEMHVDGFRFDLASALARELYAVDRLSAFFDVLRQDPVLSRVKLIAEPWDLGSGGYQVGNFPVGWAEWNDKYRDTMRACWKGEGGIIGEFAQRLTGSSDLYNRSSRRPYASINFFAAHDGFTLADVVSYNDKHNEANGEENRDGHGHNLSWNCGAEGPSDDPGVRALRARQQRNFIATLLLSQGVPMLLAGDEIGRSQGGNNNAYCQDNEISWLDWTQGSDQRALLAFTERLVALRAAHPVFHRRDFFQGRPLHGSAIRDIVWLQPDGSEMTEQEWGHDHARALAVFLSGDGLNEVDGRGRAVRDDSFVLLFNADANPVTFTLPADLGLGAGELLIDTALAVTPPQLRVGPATPYELSGRALALIRFATRGQP
ncbi:MAG: glycogen debranching protein GlgX, partial [Rubrivivax sp.]|nr:glycogen debranching protein GlgX [Rubrivivax sp.]